VPDFLNLNPRPVPFRQLSAERLASTIHKAASEPVIQQIAAELGQKLSKENGVQRAVEIINSL